MSRKNRYHHGDLRTALIDAGLALARADGMSAVTVRTVTREAGVSPSAAYRHFDDRHALVVAVAMAAQGHLAAAIDKRIGPLVANAKNAADAAVVRLRGIGLGYIDFALTEPGLYELALLTFDPGPSEGEPSVQVEHEVPAAFAMLLAALDECLDAGVLTAAEREHAEWPCWSAVHGFADIATRGPLRDQDPAVLERLGAHVVDRIIAGLKHT